MKTFRRAWRFSEECEQLKKWDTRTPHANFREWFRTFWGENNDARQLLHRQEQVKTARFSRPCPCSQQIDVKNKFHNRLSSAPTVTLSPDILGRFERYSKYSDRLKEVLPVYGGSSIDSQNSRSHETRCTYLSLALPDVCGLEMGRKTIPILVHYLPNVVIWRTKRTKCWI